MAGIFDQILEAIRALIAPKPMSEADLTLQFDKQAEGTGLNWRESVVDFLTLLRIDASAENREALCEELGVMAGQVGSAERNEGLRKAVFNKIALNGGDIPASLRD